MKIRCKNLKLFFVFFLGLFLLVVPQWSYAAEDIDTIDAERSIVEVFEYLNEAHLSHPQTEQLMNGAIRGMIDTLADPYTVYLNASELDQLTRNLGDYYAGIGIYLEKQQDYPLILQVYPDSPAARVGLKAGDIIIKIDGIDIKAMDLNNAVNLISGAPGSELELLIKRESKSYTFKVYREMLTAPNIASRKIGSSTGYISIQSFGENTAKQFKNHLNQLQSQKITGLIIDLRDNIGGYIDSAVEMAEIFLEQDKLIVVTENFEGSKHKYISQEKLPVKISTVILVNDQTASAAELFSAALRDNSVAILVGKTTFGKGTAQSIIPLESGGALKMTTAEYITPKGTHVEGQGLTPDYDVANPELHTFFALNLLEPGISAINFNINKQEVVIAKEIINTDSLPVFRNNTYFLPLRLTLEALGYTVHWDGYFSKITANKEESELSINSRGEAVINGRALNSIDGFFLENGRSYISTELLFDLGCQVNINREFIRIAK